MGDDGRGSPEPCPSDARRIAELEAANDRARDRLCHYAAALTRAWELLDDLARTTPNPVSPLQLRVIHVRKRIGLLLQGDPWDGEEMVQELIAIRRELDEQPQADRGESARCDMD